MQKIVITQNATPKKTRDKIDPLKALNETKDIMDLKSEERFGRVRIKFR